jgi:integrase
LADGRTFGAVRLSRLTWRDIEALYAAMRAKGNGPAWVRRCATVLARAVELARKRGLVDANLSKDAARPRTVRSKPFAPTGKAVLELLAASAGRDGEVTDAAIVLASSGVRKGELIAIRWADVDRDAQEVHIGAALSDGGPGVGVVYRPTKRSDWRDVLLMVTAVEALRHQADRRRQLIGAESGAAEFVFPGGIDGTVPMRPDALSNRWAAARGASEVNLQHLRHFAATAMLDAGESYPTVADILGNSESTLRLHDDGRTDVGKRRAIAALELGSPVDGVDRPAVGTLPRVVVNAPPRKTESATTCPLSSGAWATASRG